MVKKILKNKFFILFTSLIIVVVTARFSKAYPLNSRLIVLSMGLEKEGENMVVTVEGIKPEKDKIGYQTFQGKGLTISKALSEIEANSGKKTSLAQCEIVYIAEELLENGGLKFYETKAMRELPELAVNVCCKSPKEIIGKKINKENYSFTVGETIRKNQGNFAALEVNNKDLGRDFLSNLKAVTLPYCEVVNKENSIDLVINSAVCFNEKSKIHLDENSYLAYLLLNPKNKNTKGSIKVKIDSKNEASISINKIKVKKNIEVFNEQYITNYEVYIEYLEDETYFMSNDGDKENKRKLKEEDKALVENKILSWVNNLVKISKESKIDMLKTYDKFRAHYVDLVFNEKNYMDKIKVSGVVKLSKTLEK